MKRNQNFTNKLIKIRTRNENDQSQTLFFEKKENKKYSVNCVKFGMKIFLLAAFPLAHKERKRNYKRTEEKLTANKTQYMFCVVFLFFFSFVINKTTNRKIKRKFKSLYSLNEIRNQRKIVRIK